jgi:hypothetical protein
MALPTCNEDMNIISKLDDEPNDVGGLSAASLKAKFDLAGNLLKKALNDLVAALGENAAAKNIGFAPTTAVNADNVQDAIENVQSQIAGVSQGGIADGAVTAAKIADGAVDTNAIKLGAVDTYRLKDAAVEESKIASGAVTRGKIDYDAVEGHNIVDNAVTGDKIAYYTIGSRNIGERAIVTSALADRAVTTEKIAAGAVTNEKVGDKALVESLPVTASSGIAESAVAVQSCKFVYARALGVVLFQVELRGLSSAEITDGVSLTLSGLSKPPLAMVSCAARVQYVSTQGYAEYTTAPAMLVPDGYLTIRFPSGVVANANDSIMLSGWYFC